MHHEVPDVWYVPRHILHRLRLGKLVCLHVNDDQEIDVDDQKCNSGRPHDYWI